MIVNFEEITKEISDEEIKILESVKQGFIAHTGKENAITGKVIASKLNSKFNMNLTDVRIRKIVNYLRSVENIPILASSKGYYFSTDKTEIELEIASMQQRINSIEKAKNGLRKFIEKTI